MVSGLDQSTTHEVCVCVFARQVVEMVQMCIFIFILNLITVYVLISIIDNKTAFHPSLRMVTLLNYQR